MPMMLTHRTIVELLRASGEAGHYLEHSRPNSKAKRIANRLKVACEALQKELMTARCQAEYVGGK